MRKTSAVLALFALGASTASAETIAAITDTGTLLTFDADHPADILSSVPVTGLLVGEVIVGIDVRPATGELHALTGAGRLYVIDPNTGAAVLRSLVPVALSGADFGIDFNPAVDRLRVVSDTGSNIRLHPDTGALVATDTPLAFAPGDSNFGATPMVVDIAYVNNTPGGASTTLFGVDFGLHCTKTLPDGSLVPAPCIVRIGGTGGTPSPNTGEVSTIDAFGREGITLRGFDVSPGGRAYKAVTLRTTPTVVVAVVDVDLSTGIDSSLGEIGDGHIEVRDIAVLPSLQFSKSRYSGFEGGSNVVLTVTRTGGTVGAVSVDFATVTGTASADRDYATTRGTLSFADGDTAKVISIALPQDDVREDDEFFQVFLSDPAGGGAALGNPSVATVRISANDVVDRSGPVIEHFGLTGPSGGITGAVVRFNEDLDPAAAVNLANYTLIGIPKKGRKLTVTFNSAIYDPTERTVTLGVLVPIQQPLLKAVTFIAKGKTGGLKDAAGNLLDGKKNGRPGSDAALKFKVFSGTTVKIADSDGDVATLVCSGGGHVDGLIPLAKGPRSTQFWIVGAIPLSTTVTGTVAVKPKSNGIVVFSEIIGLDKKEFTNLLTNPSFRVNTLTFSTNATGR